MNPVSDKRKAAFEVIVLGSGGGPLETDCSGYLVKPLGRRWEDGLVGLEGGECRTIFPSTFNGLISGRPA